MSAEVIQTVTSKIMPHCNIISAYEEASIHVLIMWDLIYVVKCHIYWWFDGPVQQVRVA